MLEVILSESAIHKKDTKIFTIWSKFVIITHNLCIL